MYQVLYEKLETPVALTIHSNSKLYAAPYINYSNNEFKNLEGLSAN